MVGKSIRMSKLKQILLLRSNGISLQTISRSLNISRPDNSVNDKSEYHYKAQPYSAELPSHSRPIVSYFLRLVLSKYLRLATPSTYLREIETDTTFSWNLISQRSHLQHILPTPLQKFTVYN